MADHLKIVAAQPDSPEEARCPSRLHFKVVRNLIEIKCSDFRCTGGNSIVYHYFSPDGFLVETKRHREPFPPERTK